MIVAGLARLEPCNVERGAERVGLGRVDVVVLGMKVAAAGSMFAGKYCMATGETDGILSTGVNLKLPSWD